MKKFNYIIAVWLLLAGLYNIVRFFIYTDSSLFFLSLGCVILSIIFYLFFLIELRNEEISNLRQTVLNYKKLFMLED